MRPRRSNSRADIPGLSKGSQGSLSAAAAAAAAGSGFATSVDAEGNQQTRLQTLGAAVAPNVYNSGAAAGSGTTSSDDGTGLVAVAAAAAAAAAADPDAAELGGGSVVSSSVAGSSFGGTSVGGASSAGDKKAAIKALVKVDQEVSNLDADFDGKQQALQGQLQELEDQMLMNQQAYTANAKRLHAKRESVQLDSGGLLNSLLSPREDKGASSATAAQLLSPAAGGPSPLAQQAMFNEERSVSGLTDRWSLKLEEEH